MADKKISQLTGAATPLAGSEVLPIVQSGSTVKVSVDNLTAGKTVKAVTFDTDVAAAKVTLTGTTLAASGTDTNIDINLTPKGTGEVNITKVDIDAGAIDGATIGASSAAAGTFTTISTNNTITATGGNGYSQIFDGVFSSNRSDALYIQQMANAPIVFLTNTSTDCGRFLATGQFTTTGNVGVAVTPSSWDSQSKVVQLGGGTIWSYQTSQINLVQNAYYDGSGFKYVNNGFAGAYRQENGTHFWQTAASGTAGNAITFSTPMNLLANGALCVGRATQANLETISAEFTGNNDGVYAINGSANPTGNGFLINFSNGTGTNVNTVNCFRARTAGADRFFVYGNGGVANYQTNNVDLSDARTKKEINPVSSMWDKIGALEIVSYKYNDQTHDDANIGVIAQQVETVEPLWVESDGFGDTPEDGVPLKTVYTKDIYFAAIKALQEAMVRIEKLEAEVAALKNS